MGGILKGGNKNSGYGSSSYVLSLNLSLVVVVLLHLLPPFNDYVLIQRATHNLCAVVPVPVVSACATLLRGAVGRDVGGGEESFAVANLTVPPVLVLAVGHRDDVAPPKVQLARLLWHKVVQRLHEHLLRHHILQLDVLRSRHAGRAMVVDQLVQRVELDHPQEELALRVPQHLEVLHAVRTPTKGGGGAFELVLRLVQQCI